MNQRQTMRLLSFVSVLVVSIITTYAQDTYYYKQIRVEKNGTTISQGTGGQFISFYKDICYDSNNKGVSVNNGQMERTSEGGDKYKLYKGTSYWGRVIYYFSTSLEKLVVEKSDGTTYLYQRATPPSGVTTCSLIKSKSSGNSYSGTAGGYIDTPTYNGGWNNTQSGSTYEGTTSTPRQKTKVRNKCPYCTNGEVIQEESRPTFGLDGPPVYCSKCNKYFSFGTVHKHHECRHCKGKGYTEYEY